MKTSAVITLLLVALTASSVGGENEAVIDTNANPVMANTPYRVSTFIAAFPEYLSRQTFHANVSSCRERAVSTFKNIFPGRGEPVVFVLPPSSSGDNVVRISTELNIKFTYPSRCNESGIWRVSRLEDKTSFETVLQDGAESRNDSTFTVRKTVRGTYKFFFGSSVDLDDNSTEIIGDHIYAMRPGSGEPSKDDTVSSDTV
ncbi:unnamed protein product [Microthlaspi erraticum]|uniref:Uncharacterized protein n=1 Tax=Microthlaspi erraticum TaxID=1685480 RepID=A0A6D2L1H1_9BRAS|nr:unnamed protein product [Microthlaspi erraticum]